MRRVRKARLVGQIQFPLRVGDRDTAARIKSGAHSGDVVRLGASVHRVTPHPATESIVSRDDAAGGVSVRVLTA
jgi:hypothetical protein